jgi:hypothetical protein
VQSEAWNVRDNFRQTETLQCGLGARVPEAAGVADPCSSTGCSLGGAGVSEASEAPGDEEGRIVIVIFFETSGGLNG